MMIMLVFVEGCLMFTVTDLVFSASILNMSVSSYLEDIDFLLCTKQ